MSKASTEHTLTVAVMQTAVLNNAFSKAEVEAMLMEAFKRMTVTEMEQLVVEHTTYEDMMDLEVRL